MEDALDRAFMYNAAEKLKRLAEPECSRFIAGVRSAMAEMDGSIHRKLALARAEKMLCLGMTCQAGSVSRKTQGI